MTDAPARRRPPEKSVAESLVRETLDDLAPCKYLLSTGSTLLDLAVSGRCPGGVGSGRITQIFGDEATAKTLLCQEILGSAQRLGGSVVFEDAEHTLDFSRARRLFGLDVGPWADEALHEKYLDEDNGYDAKTKKRKIVRKFAEACRVFPRFTYRTPSCVEDLWDSEIGEALAVLEGDDPLPGPLAMGVDTLAALPSLDELESQLTDGTYGTSRAKQYSAAFRKYTMRMALANMTVVAIDQTRDKISEGYGQSFGPKSTIGGGRAMRYYASTRIELAHAGIIKNKFEVVQGVKIRFKIVKNKISSPYREGLVHVLFDYGIDDVTANLEWLLEEGKGLQDRLTRSGSWYAWGDKKLGQGLPEAARSIEEAGLEKEVQSEVVRVWTVRHEPPARKEKLR